MKPLKPLGLGIGWRPELALAIERTEHLGFIELLAENVGEVPAAVRALQRERGVQVVLHGVSLSLGGTEPLDPRRLDRLGRLAEETNAALISEHVCFVRSGGIESGHLLPVPRTEEALEVLTRNIEAAKRVLPVPLVLENIASLVAPGEAVPEGDFIRAVLERTDCGLLLDVANLYANRRNHSGNLTLDEELARWPLERLVYAHVAGGTMRWGKFIDTHAHRIPPGTWEVLSSLARHVRIPGALLERDDAFPAEAELHEEAAAIAGLLKSSAGTPERRERVVLPSGAKPLAEANLELITALVKGEGSLTQRADVQVAQRSLLAKRWRTALQAWPGLEATGLEQFREYAKTEPLNDGACGGHDALAYARWLGGRLSADLQRERLRRGLAADARRLVMQRDGERVGVKLGARVLTWG